MILGVLKLGLRVMELFFDAAVVAPPQLAEMVLIILFIVTE